MRTRQFHVFWVLVLLLVVWASELATPPMPGVATTKETVIPLPSPPARHVVSVPAAEFSGAPITTDTCFEREPEGLAAVDEYAPDGGFATGIESAPLILAVYKRYPGMDWDYAERCSTSEYYKRAKRVKKLRTASLANEFPHDWRPGPGGSRGGGHPSGYGPPRITPNVLDSGGGGGFGPGGGPGGGNPGGGPDAGGPGGPSLVGDNDNPPGGKNPPGDPGPGGDGPGHPDPGSGPDGPGNTGPGGGDPTILPEPGSLALFLGLMLGFGLLRHRVSSI